MELNFKNNMFFPIMSTNLDPEGSSCKIDCLMSSSQTQNTNSSDRLNFWAIPSKYSKSPYLFKLFEWCFYEFLIFLLVLGSQKSQWAVYAGNFSGSWLVVHSLHK